MVQNNKTHSHTSRPLKNEKRPYSSHLVVQHSKKHLVSSSVFHCLFVSVGPSHHLARKLPVIIAMPDPYKITWLGGRSSWRISWRRKNRRKNVVRMRQSLASSWQLETGQCRTSTEDDNDEEEAPLFAVNWGQTTRAGRHGSRHIITHICSSSKSIKALLYYYIFMSVRPRVLKCIIVCTFTASSSSPLPLVTVSTPFIDNERWCSDDDSATHMAGCREDNAVWRYDFKRLFCLSSCSVGSAMRTSH
jgi:hypothetical protein